MKIEDRFVHLEPINKGWSGDRKYCALTSDNLKYLLRTSDITEFKIKEHEFNNMKRMADAGVQMPRPLDFGICDNGKRVYQLTEWIEGTEAKELLPSLTENAQYEFGKEAARIFRQMETIDCRAASMEWEKSFRKRVAFYIELYSKCGYTFDEDERILNYLRTRWQCIGERPTALMHMDFQTDNMIISPDGSLYIIDFQMCGITDPYLVMTGTGVSAMYSVPFAMGQMDGYFGKNVPEDFWEKYAYYMLAEMLYAFTVGVNIESEREETLHMFDDEIRRMKQNGSYIPAWYQNMRE